MACPDGVASPNSQAGGLRPHLATHTSLQPLERQVRAFLRGWEWHPKAWVQAADSKGGGAPAACSPRQVPCWQQPNAGQLTHRTRCTHAKASHHDSYPARMAGASPGSVGLALLVHSAKPIGHACWSVAWRTMRRRHTRHHATHQASRIGPVYTRVDVVGLPVKISSA
jgi:hypothetical protein